MHKKQEKVLIQETNLPQRSRTTDRRQNCIVQEQPFLITDSGTYGINLPLPTIQDPAISQMAGVV